MAEWIETYRGVVSAWECDIVEHFTIAYYFERFADATRNFLELIGEGETLGPAVGTGPSRLYTAFTRELRAGAGFHMLSAVVSGRRRELVAARSSGRHFGTRRSRVVGHGNASASRPRRRRSVRRRLEARAVAWPGPEVPEAVAQATTAGRTHRPRPREAVGARREAGRCRSPPTSIAFQERACSSSPRSA